MFNFFLCRPVLGFRPCLCYRPFFMFRLFLCSDFFYVPKLCVSTCFGFLTLFMLSNFLWSYLFCVPSFCVSTFFVFRLSSFCIPGLWRSESFLCSDSPFFVQTALGHYVSTPPSAFQPFSVCRPHSVFHLPSFRVPILQPGLYHDRCFSALGGCGENPSPRFSGRSLRDGKYIVPCK